ncbi:MAG: SpoIID/LytB domain-containing protein [Planctomycetes bacterium]|jgi:SpoIID/LytB domain protein|nr:SpoIID/LytB domain-containing protein [Planctomycetota bacterium]
MRRIHLLLVLAVALTALFIGGCQIDSPYGSRTERSSAPTAAPTRTPPVVVDAPAKALADDTFVEQAPAPATPGKKLRQVPKITSEPLIGVMLASGPEVALQLPRGGTITHAGIRTLIQPGALHVRATGKGLTTSATGNSLLGDHIRIQVPPAANAPTFSATLDVPFGKPQTLQFSGQPEVAIDAASRKAMLIERVGLEQYLKGVLPTEISPSWPLEAIKAQAVAARSYTLDRYLVRLNQPWQLHWHFTVDQAYGGLKPLPPRMAVALEQTRGQLLASAGLPIPALFHACSGGRTESARNFRADLTGADNVTDMTAVMPSVDDPDGISGAEALGFSATHLDWRVEVPMATVTANLQKWAATHPEDRMRIGTVSSVRPVDRFPDSNRVATVTVRHLLNNREIDTVMSAATFRLAVGPGQIRSTNWKRCVIASAKGGILVIEGRGYGHGVGMSQVSAYQMARTGSAASDILKRFYPGAGLVQWW